MRGKNTLEMDFGDQLLMKATEMDHFSFLERVSSLHPFGKEGRQTELYNPSQSHTWGSGADCSFHPPLNLADIWRIGLGWSPSAYFENI